MLRAYVRARWDPGRVDDLRQTCTRALAADSTPGPPGTDGSPSSVPDFASSLPHSHAVGCVSAGTGGPMRRTHLLLLAVVVVVAGACVPLATPADTNHIEAMGTTTVDGWRYDTYRDRGYPCSRQRLPDVRHRHQGRVVDDRRRAAVGVSCTVAASGTSTSTGNPVPGTGPEGRGVVRVAALERLNNNGLFGKVRADPAGFRTLAVSYCSHDLYAGGDPPTRTTRTPTPDGKPRPTTGLLATKAAIAVRARALPDDEDVPPRRQRRFGGHLRRGVVDAAAGHRAGGRRRRREHRERRGVRRRQRGRDLHRRQPGTGVTGGRRPHPPRPRQHRQRAGQARVESVGSPCRSCTSGTTAT